MELDSQILILFDVDQTLVSLRGGSAKALNSAFEEVHGIPDAFRGMTSTGGLNLPHMKRASYPSRHRFQPTRSR